MKNEFELMEYIGSRKFMLWVTFFAVLVLTPNTYFVYYSMSDFVSPWRELFSASVALLVASFIMIYTRRKNYMVAKYYSWFEVSISCYYYIMTISQSETLTLWGLIPALGFTIILPVSVYHCARELEKEDNVIQTMPSIPIPGITAEEVLEILKNYIPAPAPVAEIIKPKKIRERKEPIEGLVMEIKKQAEDGTIKNEHFVEAIKEIEPDLHGERKGPMIKLTYGANKKTAFPDNDLST